jgi:hypothetical protein
MIGIGYGMGLAIFLLSARTDWLVQDGVYLPWATHFKAGPLFWLYTLYFAGATLWGTVNLARARQRTLTPASRRRLTYLTISLAAPVLGAFPYLLLANLPNYLPPSLFLGLTLAGGMGIALMTVVMTYSVAYQGILLPDRVVKRSLIQYLLRGPFVGSSLLILMLVMPRVEQILGLPRDTALIFAMVLGIVALQAFISALSPVLDWLIYRRDRSEIAWMRELDARLLTTTDLQVTLENILAALCDLLRVETGFVVGLHDGRRNLQAILGSGRAVQQFLDSPSASELNGLGRGRSAPEDFAQVGEFWVLPLRTKSRQAVLGVLGVQAPRPLAELSEAQRQLSQRLIQQVELALEDRQLQEGVFQVLWQIAPEIRSLQRWQSLPRYRDAPAWAALEESPIYAPDFAKVVKDALSHYWGGPKLADSPLLKLGIVQRALQHNGNRPVNALRGVLEEAIEALKPAESDRNLSSRDWVLYNILEMKFIRGWRSREIAQRLAMSEADLYRKQRVAIEAVARVLATMEEQRG